ncbi:MAG: hypothetical protein PHN44_00470 [Candidatus Marinimicrobia bacterium]|nr:hypothetical protein [Candidatus Neomarinimicrobiota bacterium]MDD5539070.1 hypothetical protein [Candidatus Neomarinimicrobiota bacterium]
MQTPWGQSDYRVKIADGIVSHNTPSHGGIHVEAQLNSLIPDYMRNESGWYEEDCEWAVVAVVFPQVFGEDQAKRAIVTLKNWLPDSAEKFFGIKLKPGESCIKDQRLFQKTHEKDYLVMSAWGDWKDGIPKGFVGCFAVRGGRTESGLYASTDQAYFLVPEAEYDTRGGFSFVIDESKHQRIKEII